MNRSKSIRWGVIGLGWFGEVHADNVAEMPDIELTALCTRRPERLGEIADRLGVEKRYTDYHQLLADPDVDVVSVTTHFYDHRQITIDALRAGKHVLLEKPMAPTVADCDQIVAAAEAAGGLFIRVSHWRRKPSSRGASEKSSPCTLGGIFPKPSAVWCWMTFPL